MLPFTALSLQQTCVLSFLFHSSWFSDTGKPKTQGSFLIVCAYLLIQLAYPHENSFSWQRHFIKFWLILGGLISCTKLMKPVFPDYYPSLLLCFNVSHFCRQQVDYSKRQYASLTKLIAKQWVPISIFMQFSFYKDYFRIWGFGLP
jgi:uncharacterized membrane protein YhhN